MHTSTIINAIVETLNSGRATPIPSFIGAQHLDAHGTPPRLVWVPTVDSFGDAKNHGISPASVKTRYAGYDCAIWCASIDDCEQMLADLMLALDAQRDSNGLPVRGFYRIGGLNWINEQALIAKGAACDLEITFELPLVAAAPTTAPISEVIGTCTTPNP